MCVIWKLALRTTDSYGTEWSCLEVKGLMRTRVLKRKMSSFYWHCLTMTGG